MFGISSTKFDVVKFDGSGNFGLWQRRIKDLLVQQGMVKVLYGKQLDGMNNMDWKDLEAKTAATIKLCLVDDVMYHVMDEESPTTFEDEDKALMLLNSLSISSMYENLVTTLMWGKETLDLEEIMSILLDSIRGRTPMMRVLKVKVCGVATVESELENIVLWHMRLGHMGECGVMELHKRNLLKDLEKKFWAEAMNMACYLINRSPRATLDGKVAKEVWTGNPVDYSGLRVFGCLAYVHIPNEERSKLDLIQVELQTHDIANHARNAGKSSSEDQQHHSIAIDRSRHTIKPPTRYGFEDLVSDALITSSGDPTTFQEAMHNQEKSRWIGVMMEKIQSLHKNQTWDLVELLEGKRAIGCKWGEKLKARLIAKGYS
ncbi:hypothetical protein AAG906_012680 [Vitis piasezkii]